jgi:hypothetical protein
MLTHRVRFIMCSDTDTLSKMTVIHADSCDCLDDYTHVHMLIPTLKHIGD